MLDKEMEKKLIEKAFEMKEKAYCPYSKYHVGAALLTKSGKIYGGHNIENSSYGATVCAERTAVFKAVSEGEREIIAIAICGGLEGTQPKGDEHDNAFPCGICRQVLREFSNPKDLIVYVCPTKDKYNKFTLEELLPHSFGPEFLLDDCKK
jgi:cytidine deaminase